MILLIKDIGSSGYQLIRGYTEEVLTPLCSNVLYDINFSEVLHFLNIFWPQFNPITFSNILRD